MTKDIESSVQHCVAFSMFGNANQPVANPLEPIALPPEPWHTISIEIFGEVHWAPAHQRYFIRVSDLYSNWKEVALRGTITSSAVIKMFTKLFARHGLHCVLIPNNRNMFTSVQFRAPVAFSGIKVNLTALYHSQSNGAIKHFHKSARGKIKSRAM